MISILMPVYNAAPFLADCIDSIINQTETNWELIAVDDISTDKSLSILKYYEKMDERIHIYQNIKKGIIPALRLAYAKSKGLMITRMDADDIMASNKLELLKTALVLSGVGHISTGLVEYFSETKVYNGYKKYEEWINNLTISENNFEEIYKECVIPSPCWMIFREDLDYCGAFNPNTYPEDYDLCFRFYQFDMEVVGVDQVIHKWRDHPNRASRTDKNYADNHFFKLKLAYFLALNYYHSRKIVIWGTGNTGKELAKELRYFEKPFDWVTNNPKKIGHKIMNVEIESYKKLPMMWQPQILVAVSSPEGKAEIQAFFNRHQYEQNYHYFWMV